MRDRLPDFDYHSPERIEEVVKLLWRLDNAKVLQGGTDLLVGMKQEVIRPKHVVSLRKLRGLLGKVNETDGKIRIGASVTFGQLERSAIVKKKLAVLREAVQEIASYQIRNVATIGGNLCNASPCADSAPPLLVLGATLKIQGRNGVRELPIEKFFKGPGETTLRKGELLKEIEVPKMKPNSGAAFIKLGRRLHEDISVVSAACMIQLHRNVVKEVRIALGSVAPTPMRAYKAEDVMRGKPISDRSLMNASQVAMTECSPISDVRASAKYRTAMVGVLTRSAIKEAAARAKEAKI